MKFVCKHCKELKSDKQIIVVSVNYGLCCVCSDCFKHNKVCTNSDNDDESTLYDAIEYDGANMSEEQFNKLRKKA